MGVRAKDGELSDLEAEFCLRYEGNGRNATAAYLAVKPGVSRVTAATEGYKLLRKPQIAAKLLETRTERFKALNMEADEAAALVAVSARADIRLMFGPDGKQLPIHEWPDELAQAVKAIKADGSVTLHDQLKARETILQMTGKLKQVVDVNHFDHVGYLARKNQEHKGRAHADEGQAAAQPAGRDTPQRAGGGEAKHKAGRPARRARGAGPGAGAPARRARERGRVAQ